MLTCLLLGPAWGADTPHEVRRWSDDGEVGRVVMSADARLLLFEVRIRDVTSDLYSSSITGPIAKDAVRITLPGTNTFEFGNPLRMMEHPAFVEGAGTTFLVDVAVQDDLPTLGVGMIGGGAMSPGGPDAALATWATPGTTLGQVAFVSSEDPRQLMLYDDMRSGRAPRLLYEGSELLSQPSWSPDGTQIAVESGGSALVVDVATGGVAWSASGCAAPVHAGAFLYCFARDESVGAYVLERRSPEGAITAVLRGVALPLDARSGWSPGLGRFCVGVTDPEHHGRIAIVDAAGELRFVETGLWDVRDVAISPRGSRDDHIVVAFTARPDVDAPRNLFLMEVP